MSWFRDAIGSLVLCALPALACRASLDLEYGFSESPVDCLPGQNASGLDSPQVACLPSQEVCQGSQVRCDGLAPQLCSEGKWLAQPACSLGCAGGRCTECVGGGRCRDGAVETCVDGFWQFSRRCPLACESGQCLDACSEGRAQCNGDTLQRCQGGEYVDEEACPTSCLSTERGDGCGGECRRSSVRCTPDENGNPANGSQRCTDEAVWGPASSACDGVFCVAGVCQPCSPAARRCGAAGPEQCSEVGQWVPEPACAGELPACVDGACARCEPAALRCNGDALEVCNDSGSGWLVEKQCTGGAPTCLDSLEDCGRCVPGDRQCRGNTVQVCSDEGSNQDESSCAGDTPKCLQGVCRACDPGLGETRCLDTQRLQACSLDGSWGALAPCAGDTPLCRTDLGRCGCEEGAGRCSADGTPERCLRGGWVRQAPCSGEAAVCLASSGQCVACQPGTETCLQNIVQRCDSAGSYQSTGECSSNQRNCGSCDVGERCSGDTECRSGTCLGAQCVVCRPATTQCVGSTPRTCAPEGNWVNAASCAGELPVCVPETASCICREGSSVCVDTSAERRCAGGQLVQSVCDIDSLCQGDRCRVQEWTRQFGTMSFDQPSMVSVDATGSVIVAGVTGGALPGQTYGGNIDSFVRKYTTNGTELWTRQFGMGDVRISSGRADRNGNLFVAGYVAAFTPPLPGQTLVGSNDAFVRKYDANGTELWTQQFGTNLGDDAHSTAVDASGNVLVVGQTNGVLSGQTPAGGNDAFVRKYTTDGFELWTSLFGTAAGDVAYAVCADAADNVIVAGSTGGSLPGQATAGSDDIFVRKLDANGGELWTRQIGTVEYDSTYAVSVDDRGNVFLGGYAGGAFVRKYDPDGAELWTRQLNAEVAPLSITNDAAGNVIVAGRADGALPGQTNLGVTDAFVRKYDAEGTELGSRQFGSSDYDAATSVSVDAKGSVIVAGETSAALPGQTTSGGTDTFVLKLVE